MTKRFRWLLSGAFALLALLGCLAYGDAVRSEAETAREEALQRYGGEVTTIVVASRDLEIGDVVSERTCEERDWVTDFVPEGALTALAEISGSSLTSPVSKGTPITQVALRDASEMLDIPAGMAAYTIAVNERTGVLSSVPLGTTLVAYRITDEGTRLISSDVTVIGRDPDGASKITVAVPYEDVSALIESATDRSLRLVQPSGLSDEPADLVVGDASVDDGSVDEGAADASGEEFGDEAFGDEAFDDWDVEADGDVSDDGLWDGEDADGSGGYR